MDRFGVQEPRTPPARNCTSRPAVSSFLHKQCSMTPTPPPIRTPTSVHCPSPAGVQPLYLPLRDWVTSSPAPEWEVTLQIHKHGGSGGVYRGFNTPPPAPVGSQPCPAAT